MKMQFSSTIAAVLTVALVVASSSRVAEGQSDCASKLIPCVDYLNSTNPSPDCCNAIKEVVTTQLPCLCRLYENPALLPGINITQALMIPKYCNLPADTTACSALAPGSSQTPPAVPSGRDNNGAGTISWVGFPALVLASALTFLY